jgi:hypothetical protein
VVAQWQLGCLLNSRRRLKTPTGGGTPEKLGIRDFVPSFDGTSVVGGDPESCVVRMVRLDGGGEQSILESLPGFGGNPFGFAIGPHGLQGLYAVVTLPPWSAAGSLILHRSPAGPTSTVRGVEVAEGYGMSLSPNGRSLLYSRFVSSGADLTLVENFK